MATFGAADSMSVIDDRRYAMPVNHNGGLLAANALA
jgi:hypothetical protein